MTTHSFTTGGFDAKPLRDPLHTSAILLQLLADQEGGCAICAEELVVAPNAVDNLTGVVDHDDSTGAVRGLLCHRCHGGIARFGGDPARLRGAAAYLRAGRAGRPSTNRRAVRSAATRGKPRSDVASKVPSPGGAGMTEAVT